MPNAFNGYPFADGGAKSCGLLPNGHKGPASYTQVTTGPLAGGDVLQAADFSLTWLENVNTGITADGLYYVDAIMPVTGPFKSVILYWSVVATGAQVAGGINLSASIVNLMATGF
jgi:hypothetical protein